MAQASEDRRRITALADDVERAAIWLFTGDSITHGTHHTRGRRGYSELFAERLRYERGALRQFVVNTGVSGERTGGFLDDFDHRVTRFAPDVVSVMWGMNDAPDGPTGHEQFGVNLRVIIDRIRALGAIPLVQTPPAIDAVGEPGRIDLPAYVDVVREVARSHNCVVIDHHAHWSAAGNGTAPPPDWLGNAFHPNARGHVELVRLMLAGLDLGDLAGAIDP